MMPLVFWTGGRFALGLGAVTGSLQGEEPGAARLRQQLIDGETREPVAPEHKGRGYELAKARKAAPAAPARKPA